ncbi:MAG: Nif3-like dinuclear metal center hexameric protein, partial [Congregibacter sp.]|nr:Nif3-like dinuclear metal center hexameric protein [Congregibacter sp.]
LGLLDIEALDQSSPQAVGNVGRLGQPKTLEQMVQQVLALTGRAPQLIGDPARSVERIAWCTGAAQGYIDKAAAAGAQLYISGEISEPTVHAAREMGIAYMAAGHHATERYGVQALAALLADRFALEWTFLDCDNPV